MTGTKTHNVRFYFQLRLFSVDRVMEEKIKG